MLIVTSRNFKIVAIAITLLIFFLALTTNIWAQDDVRIIREDPTGVTLQFSPQEWHTVIRKIEEESFSSIYFKGSQLIGEPGEPQIPVKSLLVAVPLQGEVYLTIVESPYDEIDLEPILPIPFIGRDEEGLIQETYDKRIDIYSSSAPYPYSAAAISEPMFFRDQRVVKLLFKPVQYLPQTGTVRKYRSITAGIRFAQPPEIKRPMQASHVEDLYNKVIINYEQSKFWRKSRPAQLKKATQRTTSGMWYKIFVNDRGVYKVDGNQLNNAGIDLASIDLSTLRLYNNGGRELPRNISFDRPDSLIENPILLRDGGDGQFDASDYFLFFGRGVNGWRYDSSSTRWSHYINHYTAENAYWLTWGQGIPGKRIETIPSAPIIDAQEVTSFRDHIFYEEDVSNPFHGGFYWFGKKFDNASQYRNYTVELPGAIASDSTNFYFKFVGVSAGQQTFYASINEYPLGNCSISGSSSASAINLSFDLLEKNTVNQITAGSNTVGIRYTGSSQTSEGYMDWFEIEYARSLTAYADELLVYAPPTDELLKYSVTGFSQNDITILDITEISSIKQIEPASLNSGTVTFADYSRSEDGKQYYLFTPSTYRTPAKIEQDVVSDLRSGAHVAQLIIITHDDFYSQAMQLKSLRETWNPHRIIPTEVVKISDIYDEFSWGLYDATAIRDFIKYAYDQWESDSLKWVLLLGDGDFDYRNIISKNDNNWIPAYQSLDGNSNASRTSDDWFVCVSGDDDIPDLSIGRIPAQTVSEAQNVADKIISYETEPAFGDWRNTITMVGDDELLLGGVGNELVHMNQTEGIAESLIPKSFDLKKIYLVEYPAVRSPSISGVIKPAANQDLIEQINRGTLIINFIGHGAPQLWTHERVLNSPTDFNKIQNGNKYGFWIAATCDFARFDDPYEQSLSEDLINASERGAIGLLSSARLAYSGENADLNSNFIINLFELYFSKNKLRSIGEALLLSKISGASINNQKFLILGDPSMLLAAPTYKAIIDSIEPDSIQALGLTSVQGHIEKNGEVWSDYQGQVLLKTFDTRKARQYTTDFGSTTTYVLPGNIIFRGVSNVTNGRFQASFIAPKDISYGGKEGRISTYFWNNEYDGIGYHDDLHIGGTGATILDNIGPNIEIGFINQSSGSGEYTSQSPILHVEINDSLSGVNLAGDIGHKITMVLDGDHDNRKDLTEYFNYHTGSYTDGSLDYQLTDLEEGWHVLEIRAWDNSNNSAESLIEFQVVSEDDLVLSNVLNYPNPMSNYTDFTFEISREAEVAIKIFTLAGRLVRTLPMLAQSNFNALPWDGRDEEGDLLANGVYLYQLIATATGMNGTVKTDALGKLIIMK